MVVEKGDPGFKADGGVRERRTVNATAKYDPRPRAVAAFPQVGHGKQLPTVSVRDGLFFTPNLSSTPQTRHMIPDTRLKARRCNTLATSADLPPRLAHASALKTNAIKLTKGSRKITAKINTVR